MRFIEFESIVSKKRISRYLNACGGNVRKAKTLYRYNLKLSQEMFAVISYYEVALRNTIDRLLSNLFGPDWMRDSVSPGGIFDNQKYAGTAKIIKKAYTELQKAGNYSPSKMLSSMEFGVWKYMFSAKEYLATGRVLLEAFPQKPKSSKQQQYNNLYIFNELDAINRLRNRIAHHEPICFRSGTDSVSTDFLRNNYCRILKLFDWMGISSRDYLFGIDRVGAACAKIDKISNV